jgi:hypothetical protein
MKKTQKKLDFNAGWTMGEASRQIGKKYSQHANISSRNLELVNCLKVQMSILVI